MASSSRNVVLVASVLALMVGGASSAPAAEPRPNGQAAVDDANQAGAARARHRDVNANDWFRDPAYAGGSVNGEFPSAEVSDFVTANARAAAARMIYRRAEDELSAAVRDAKRKFASSDQLRQALAEEKAAHDAYHRARRATLEAVAENARYQAILAMRDELGEEVDAHRRAMQDAGDNPVRPVIASPAGTPDLFNKASLKMQVAAGAREMERAAMEADEDLQASRARLMKASAKVSDLRRQFDDELRDDPDLLAARRAMEDARISRVTAAAYLRASRMVAEEAVNFAYYLHRHDSQVAYDPYDLYYGNYYGYGSRYRYGRY